MNSPLVLLTVLLLGVGVCGAPPSKWDPGNANDYIDMVLENLKPLLPDRVDIPDIGSDVDLHDCYLHGLEKGLYRDGDATLDVVDVLTTLDATLGSHSIAVTCKWKFWPVHGHATGTTKKVSIHATFNLEMVSGSSPKITVFDVTHMDKIKTDITGLTWAFNWLAEIIANAVVSGYKDEIINVIETTVRDLLQGELDKLVIP